MKALNRALPFLALLPVACSGGGGGGAAPTGNLTAAAFRLDHPQPTAGHEVTAHTMIAASTPMANVTVAYVLLNKADVDAERPDVRQHVIDTARFESVAPGAREYSDTIVIPSEIPFDGGSNSTSDWYLIAEIDPANAIAETDEDDNTPSDDDKIVVTLHNTNIDDADIVIENVEVDEDAVILYGDSTRPSVVTPDGTISDRSDHDFSATLVITTTGAKVVNDCDISATIVIPGEGVFELRFWNEQTQRYENELLTTITPGIANTVHADIWFPGGTRRRLQTYLGNNPSTNELAVTFSSNMTAGVAEWEMGVQRTGRSDNQFETTVVIILPPGAGNGIDWTARFKKDWRNKYFGIGIDLGGSSSLDSRGAIARGWGAVPVKLFGIAGKALDAEAYGRVTPRQNAPTESEFRLGVDVFGISIVSEERLNVSYEKTDTYSQTETYRRDGVVFAGPVPIRLTARATGSYGVETTVYMDPAELRLDVEPFANATASATAAVDVIVARFGVEGRVKLIDERLTATARALLEPPTDTTLTGVTQLVVYNRLAGPSGRLYLFAEREIIKWCHKVIPCGTRTKRNEKTLVRFRTFNKTDVLFNLQRRATVAY